MSRLVDVDKITDKEISQYLGVKHASCTEDIRSLIDDQPTAFDVEDVIEQLNKELELADKEKLRCAMEDILQFDEAKGYARGIACAIEIVKRGGRI